MTAPASSRRALLAHPSGWIATGFGSGFAPFAPGTAGSAAALVPWLLLRELAWPWYALALAVAFVVGVAAADVVVRQLRIEDPGLIVWDEFVGQWIALVPLLAVPLSVPWVGVGFVFFRLFDVLKPWPVSWADRQVKGGLGVMLDDVLAGAYAALALALLRVAV